MPEALLQQLEAATRPVLRPRDAVAALLVHEDGRYIMQLRDARAGIFYPDHWGCFGGAVEPGEDPLDALRRELAEEIEFTPQAATPFTRFDFDFAPLGHGRMYRAFYEIAVSEREFRGFVLHEGAALAAIEARALLTHHRVTPYDAFAVWMHAYQRRPA